MFTHRTSLFQNKITDNESLVGVLQTKLTNSDKIRRRVQEEAQELENKVEK